MNPLTILIIGLPFAGKTTLRRYLCGLDPEASAGGSCSDVLIRDLAALYVEPGEHWAVSQIRAAKEIRANKDKYRTELISIADAYRAIDPAGLAVSAYERYCSSGFALRVLDGIRRQEELLMFKDYLDQRGAEMLMALPSEIASTTQPEKFLFTVDDAALSKVKAALKSGKRVELIYRQWFCASYQGKPSSTTSAHDTN